MNQSETITDRLGLQVLTREQCWALVGSVSIGRVAFVDAGEPMVLPVTHSIDDNHIVFRTARGTTLTAVEGGRSIAFEADGWDDEARSGWSVVIRGTGEPVLDDAEIARLDVAAHEPWLDAARRGTWVRVRATEMSGRRIG